MGGGDEGLEDPAQLLSMLQKLLGGADGELDPEVLKKLSELEGEDPDSPEAAAKLMELLGNMTKGEVQGIYLPSCKYFVWEIELCLSSLFVW